MGSSDEIASVCGLVGSWSWERWLLRCEMEKVSGELRLADTVTAGKTIREAGKCLEGVHGVIEEGRRCSAGWRMLTGYANKPKPTAELIRLQLASKSDGRRHACPWKTFPKIFISVSPFSAVICRTLVLSFPLSFLHFSTFLKSKLVVNVCPSLVSVSTSFLWERKESIFCPSRCLQHVLRHV